MKYIFKCLKKYTVLILLIIVLLAIQAKCDLTLPMYTSDIINVGIQEGGIESITPIAIRESEMKKLVLYMSEDNAKKVIASYCYLPKGDKANINKYSILSEEGLYILDSEEDLSSYFASPMILSISSMYGISDNEYVNLDIDNSFIKSGIISYLKSEYKTIGIDTDKIQMDYIKKVGFKMILLAFAIMSITALTVYISSIVASGFGRDLREKLVKKTMDFEPQDLAKISSASLITRCTNDIMQVQGLITMVLRIIIYAPIIGIGAISKVKGSPLSWVIILSVVSIFVLLILLFVIVVPKFKLFQDLIDRLNLVSRENLSGLSTIRAFSNEEEEEKKFDKANSDLTKNGLFVGRSMSVLMPTLTLIMNSISILIIWAGSKYIDTFEMQVGDLIAFISYTMQIVMAFLMISMVAVFMPRSLVSMRRISDIFNLKKSINDKDKVKKIDLSKITVSFNNVSFKYPDAGEYVLKDINFEANEGETIAFIGSTGSGKSTIINLIPRLYEVTDGSISINGVDIKDLSINSLRDIISYVPQKGKLFKGTIRSNLEFAQKKKDNKKIDEAIKVSQSSEFVYKNEVGLDREISEGGSNVSGGQRQRLSIARALSKDFKIIIFDDSFSALDFKTDAALRKELKKVTSDKIVFVVAQRISSIMNADKIIVLEEGKVVGEGKHEDLLKTCEVYKEIAYSQIGGDK